MRLWNTGQENIEQFFNRKMVVIPSNTILEVADDLAAFLLRKRELKGKGLVQYKEGSDKEERYKQGRLNVYNWAKEKYHDYEMHCEERKSISLQPLQPHVSIVKYKEIIDNYEKWIEKGQVVDEKFGKIADGRKTVYACPYCAKEFDVKVAYFGHLRSHQKEDKDGVVSGSSNPGERKT